MNFLQGFFGVVCGFWVPSMLIAYFDSKRQGVTIEEHPKGTTGQMLVESTFNLIENADVRNKALEFYRNARADKNFPDVAKALMRVREILDEQTKQKGKVA